MALEPRNFLTVGDVAARLGVSEQTVRLWCRSRVLPAYRPPSTGQWLVEPAALEAWLKRSPVRSTIEFLDAPYRSTGISDEAIGAAFLGSRTY